MEKIIYVIILSFYTISMLKLESNASLSRKYTLKKRYLFWSLFVIYMIACLRNLAIGADLYRYSEDFNECQKEPLSLYIERFIDYYTGRGGKDELFHLFKKLFSMILPSFRCFLFVTTLMYFGPFYYFLRRYTDNIFQCYIAILLFLGLFLDVIYVFIRPVIAYGILIYAIKFVEERKLRPFLLLVFLATSFHISGIIFLPFYFIAHIKKLRFWFIAIAIIIPTLLVNIKLFMLVIVASSESERLSYYVEGGDGAGTPTFTLLIVLLTLFYLIRRKDLLKVDSTNLIWGNALLMSVAMVPITWFDQNFMRFLIYYTIMLTVLLGKMIYSVPNTSNRRLLKYAMASILILLIIKNGLSTDFAFYWQPAVSKESGKIIIESLF